MTPNGPPDLRFKRRIDWTLFATVMQTGTQSGSYRLGCWRPIPHPENRARGSTRSPTSSGSADGRHSLAPILESRDGTMSARLFDPVERTDGSGSGHAESRFRFWNRVEARFLGNVRDILKERFKQRPAERNAQLRGRFSSDDERQMLGAFWELCLHEALRRPITQP